MDLICTSYTRILPDRYSRALTHLKCYDFNSFLWLGTWKTRIARAHFAQDQAIDGAIIRAERGYSKE